MNFLDQPLFLYEFNGKDMSGIYFFIFASCEPLSIFLVEHHIGKVSQEESSLPDNDEVHGSVFVMYVYVIVL